MVRSVRAGAPAWDVSVPFRPARMPGVAMAGFGDRVSTPIDIAWIPPPAVAVLFDLGDGSLVVEDGEGRTQRERIVAGLGLRGARGRGPAGRFDCLQVRLSPAVAQVVLGGGGQLGGTVVALEDLWGREALHLQEQLRITVMYADSASRPRDTRKGRERGFDSFVASAAVSIGLTLGAAA